MNLPQLDPVEAALASLRKRLGKVEAELVPIQQASGRILARPILADRDSPPHDVSAMDGYAICLDDLANTDQRTKIPVDAIACAGQAPRSLNRGTAIQIFTGGCVPIGANCVIRREDTIEQQPAAKAVEHRFVELRLRIAQLQQGQNIRRQGENLRFGEVVLPEGSEIGPATIGSLATFAAPEVAVRKKVRIGLLQSGDELVEPGLSAQPWQIRDSNGPTLRCWLERMQWVEIASQVRMPDRLDSVKQSLAAALQNSDVVIITGGVSAGDTDFVPQAIEELGGEVIFHRLPIRPGKPILAAILDGRVVVGLPGNPVSTAITARVFAQNVLDNLTGRLPRRQVKMLIENPDERTLPLIQYRLAQFCGQAVRLVDSRGSGDLVSMAGSDGFVEIPAGSHGVGPWKFWFW